MLSKLWTWPENSGYFPKLETKGIQHLLTGIVLLCQWIWEKFGNSCCVQLAIIEVHHQHVSTTVELSRQSLYSNPRRFHYPQRENNVFVFSQTYVLINMSKSITIYLWLNCYSESSLTVFVFQVSFSVDLVLSFFQIQYMLILEQRYSCHKLYIFN